MHAPSCYTHDASPRLASCHAVQLFVLTRPSPFGTFLTTTALRFPLRPGLPRHIHLMIHSAEPSAENSTEPRSVCLSNLSMRRERVAQPRRELFFFGFLRYHRTIACCLRSSSSFSSSPKNQPTNERTNDDDALKESRRTKANTFSSSSMPFSLLLFGALLLVVVLSSSSSSSSSWAKKSVKDYSTSSKKSTKDTHTF